jgi:hypothetical protein
LCRYNKAGKKRVNKTNVAALLQKKAQGGGAIPVIARTKAGLHSC